MSAPSSSRCITGAASGIGEALAAEAATEGMRLILSDMDADRLYKVVVRLRCSGARAVTVIANLTLPGANQSLLDAAMSAYGGLDVLVNNAGVGAWGPIAELSPETLRQFMEVNFFACAENCRPSIPVLSQGDQPLIVNVSSMYGRRGIPGWGAYCASKFALCGFSEALRAELTLYAIDLMLVLPGVTNTRFAENLAGRRDQLPFDLLSGISPQQVAQRIIAGMRLNRSELIIGRDAARLIWSNRLVPRFVDWLKRRSVMKQSR